MEIQGKDLDCGWVHTLAVSMLRRLIKMAKSGFEETEEEFNTRMVTISSEARKANKSQAKPIESSKEVFGALFSPTSKED